MVWHSAASTAWMWVGPWDERWAASKDEPMAAEWVLTRAASLVYQKADPKDGQKAV